MKQANLREEKGQQLRLMLAYKIKFLLIFFFSYTTLKGWMEFYLLWNFCLRPDDLKYRLCAYPKFTLAGYKERIKETERQTILLQNN